MPYKGLIKFSVTSDLMPYKVLINLLRLVTFTCEHSTPRVFCQDPPHKNPETHTFFLVETYK